MHLTAQGIKKGDTWFGIALKVVRALLKRKIISSPNDQTAVIFYGTVRLISKPVPQQDAAVLACTCMQACALGLVLGSL